MEIISISVTNETSCTTSVSHSWKFFGTLRIESFLMLVHKNQEISFNLMPLKRHIKRYKNLLLLILKAWNFCLRYFYDSLIALNYSYSTYNRSNFFSINHDSRIVWFSFNPPSQVDRTSVRLAPDEKEWKKEGKRKENDKQLTWNFARGKIERELPRPTKWYIHTFNFRLHDVQLTPGNDETRNHTL